MARRPVAILRTEGRADAVLLAVRKRIVPAMSADDWCMAMDVQKADLAKAIARWKFNATHRTLPGVRAPRVCYGERCRQITQWLESFGGKVTSDDGRGLTTLMSNHLGVVPQTGSKLLLRMENDGLIGRQCHGKRTSAIWLTRDPVPLQVSPSMTGE